MDDIARMDRKLFLTELFRINRIGSTIALGIAGYIVGVALVALNLLHHDSVAPWLYGVVVAALIGAFTTLSAKADAQRKRFRSHRFELIWCECLDRLSRFQQVFRKFRKDQIGDFEIMPRTVQSVADSLYRALRRADVIADEINKTESDISLRPPLILKPNDPQASALYEIADRNVQEYRRQYEAVMGGVQRAEAQAVVYITTLDNLRMKLLGYGLIGKSPEIPSYDFLEALGEARLQLDAIDKALDELDLSLLPKTIAVVEMKVPEEEPTRTQTT